MPVVLLVDDDRDLVEVLAFALRRAGFAVLPAHDAPGARRLLLEEQPDLVVLDINLGPWNGFDVLSELRRQSAIPVLLLTARDAEEDKVRGLELGADDYVTKPFSHRELIARMRAHLRRHSQEQAALSAARGLLEAGPLALNVAEHRATNGGRVLDLTVTEFRVLHYLIANAGVVVPTRDILKHVWGYNTARGTDVVRVTVHRLRQKVEEDPAIPRLLHTVPGVGIMLKPEPAE